MTRKNVYEKYRKAAVQRMQSFFICTIKILHDLYCLQYGICFDIDGVVARGSCPIPEAVEAFKMLCDENSGRPKVPFVFLTNGFGSARVKAQHLQNWLQCEVTLYVTLAKACDIRFFALSCFLDTSSIIGIQ